MASAPYECPVECPDEVPPPESYRHEAGDNPRSVTEGTRPDPLRPAFGASGPGAIQTNLRANTVKILGADAPVMRGVGGDDAAVRAITPAGRRGTLEEVAATAVFLASREASYVTGHTLMVDGGWIAR